MLIHLCSRFFGARIWFCLVAGNIFLYICLIIIVDKAEESPGSFACGVWHVKYKFLFLLPIKRQGTDVGITVWNYIVSYVGIQTVIVIVPFVPQKWEFMTQMGSSVSHRFFYHYAKTCFNGIISCPFSCKCDVLNANWFTVILFSLQNRHQKNKVGRNSVFSGAGQRGKR